jgi:hypothetical protein
VQQHIDDEGACSCFGGWQQPLGAVAGAAAADGERSAALIVAKIGMIERSFCAYSFRRINLYTIW